MTTETPVIAAGRSSVELSRYKDGTYGWVIKLYYDDDEPDQDVLTRQHTIDQELRHRYNGENHA